MTLKLDEDFDARLVPLLNAEGFDADTVLAEGLRGSPDETIYEPCKANGRTLVTLDLDFSNPIHFPPKDTAGIVVVRSPQAVLPMIRATLMSVLPQLKTGMVRGKLWIVEPGRIREHDPADTSGSG
jgi:predicted nuclease of predicted toxin-antitoxin system